jgi:hypothetical protein
MRAISIGKFLEHAKHIDERTDESRSTTVGTKIF